MKQSSLFGNTKRNIPKEIEVISHRLLERGGFIRQIGSGIYAYLPLGFRVYQKVDRIIREELAKIGVQDMMMPVLHPANLWQESGRWHELDDIMFKLQDHKESDFCLSITHEEAISFLARQEISSYRDLPKIVNHNQLKFRDELRPRGGLLRLKEFTMQDAYSFDQSWEGLDESYDKIVSAYHNIFQRCGLEIIKVQADSGKMGGKDSQEFMILAESGEDTVITCNDCDYKANREKAEVFLEDFSSQEEPLQKEEIDAPRGLDMQAMVDFYNLPMERMLKTIIFKADEEFVAVTIRGDLEVNETKLGNYLGAENLAQATPEEVKELGSVVGFVGPIGLKEKGVARIIADESMHTVHNVITGANVLNRDIKNVTLGVDFEADVVLDVANAAVGMLCPHCKKGELQETRGVEVAHVFKLGTRYSETMNIFFTDENGQEQPCIMGSYGIGLDRIVAGTVEQSHDKEGIIWPWNIAPFHIHLLGLGISESTKVLKKCLEIEEKLEKIGYQVLFDNRDERPGIKFNDADLIGIPLRVVVSERNLSNDKIEIKVRKEADPLLFSEQEFWNYLAKKYPVMK